VPFAEALCRLMDAPCLVASMAISIEMHRVHSGKIAAVSGIDNARRPALAIGTAAGTPSGCT